MISRRSPAPDPIPTSGRHGAALPAPPPTDRCVTESHCITCSDEGIPMRVAAADPATGLATCVGEDGSRAEVMTALVEDVQPGDRLLVHAGTALLRLDAEAETELETELETETEEASA